MPRGLKKTFTTSLSINLIDRFRTYCDKEGLYQNEVLEKLIENLLANEVKAKGEEGADRVTINPSR